MINNRCLTGLTTKWKMLESEGVVVGVGVGGVRGLDIKNFDLEGQFRLYV